MLEFGFCFSVPGDRHRTYWFSELVGYRLLDSEDMRIPWREHDIAGSVRPVASSDAVVFFEFIDVPLAVTPETPKTVDLVVSSHF